ncbi:hypothetical protein AB1L88_08715 [Tautonia sp. JC769]|uniref:hypothetical protein n=1 Tax=Tautonia sp. JC769 TaxID=3232135 RepID=UPI003458A033
MIASWLAGLAMVGVSMTDVSDPPLAWSPSGDWVAFAVATPSVERSLASFPLFPSDEDRDEQEGTHPEDAASGLTFRIWAVRVRDNQALKVAESAYPLTSPAWGPNGRGLAFAQVAEGTPGDDLRWEVVVAFGEDREVIASRPLLGGPGRGHALLAEPVAWEPGGAVLAVPDPDQVGVELIDVKTGAQARRIDNARLVSFSPIGGRLAYFRSRGEQWELVEGDLDLGPIADRPIDLLNIINQPACWTSDGQALLYLKPGNPLAEGQQTRFFSVRVSEQIPRQVKEVESPALPGERILGSYLSVAADGLDQYFVVQFSGRPAAISYHQGSHPLDRIHPYAGMGMIGAPSLSPRGDQLAVRFGGPGIRSLPARITLKDKQLRPLVPDDELRAAWINTLAEVAEPGATTRPRPTRLPFSDEFGEVGPPSATFQRLAGLGNRLTRELGANPVSRTLRVRPIAFFSYLQKDYDAVDRVMPDVARTAMNADQALRMLGLQAQLCLAQGKQREAEAMVEFIRHQNRERIAQVEENGNGGFTVSLDDPETGSWPEELWNAAQAGDETRPGSRLEPPAMPPRAVPLSSPFDAAVTPERGPRSLIEDRTRRADP